MIRKLKVHAMSSKDRWSRRPGIASLIFAIVAGFTVLISGQQGSRMADPTNSLHVPILSYGHQEGPEDMPGLSDDWSQHHLVFSNPGTEEEAIARDKHEEWLRIVDDPRYIMQQLKRRSPAEGPAAEFVARMNELARAQEARQPEEPGVGHLQDFFRLVRDPRPGKQRTVIHRDWSENLGAYAAPPLAGGQYPAKYSFSYTSGTCTDYVVYPTGIAGSSTQATVVAYDNLYATGSGAPCSGGPSVYWAYNTGGTATLSPVISWAGDQVAYIQVNSSNQASLVLLRWANSGGTVGSPATISSVANGSYGGCTAPCYTTLTLSGATTPNDTNSPPFYVYPSGPMYVGDNSGKVHQFTNVFSGTPAESGSSTGWPATASTESSPILTGAIYDPNSKLLFLGDASGYLHSVTTTGSTSQTVATSNLLDTSSYGLVDAPLVDSTTSTSYVYVFVNNITSQKSLYINQFNASTSIASSYGTALEFTTGGTYTTASPLYAGAFDNQHTTATNGNLYFCGGAQASGSNQIPTLYQITMAATFSSSTVHAYNTVASGNATCSPVTEFYNSNDYIFLSVSANGNATGCTGPCLYNYIVPNNTTTHTGTATAGLAVQGGASGTIIDNNSSSTGESQIYFFALNNTFSTTLSAAITSTTATSISVASGTGITNGDYIKIDSEIMGVSAGGGTASLTVTRGQLSTTAATHSSGAAVNDTCGTTKASGGCAVQASQSAP
jgi:hypothetical protein